MREALPSLCFLYETGQVCSKTFALYVVDKYSASFAFSAPLRETRFLRSIMDQILSNACFISAIRSSTSSRPSASLTRLSSMPIFFR